jgi:exodeoxyribonuclease V beta subunit
VPADAKAAAVLADLVTRSAGTVAVEPVDAPPERLRWPSPQSPRPPLSVATLRRRLDPTWRRTSYTGLTAAAHEHQPGTPQSEPETTGVTDEQDVVRPGPAALTPATTVADLAAGPLTTGDEAVRRAVSPMAHLPGGAAFGTLVHGVLERVDTGATDLDAELLRRCRDATTARVPGVDAGELAAALSPVLATPLGPLAGGRALRDIPPPDRLAELEFELPLTGGDTPSGPGSTLDGVADLLRRHLPADDPFAPYPDRLLAAGIGAARLRGYLTGSLDAVLRVPGAGGEPTYVIVDYKTNRLAAEDELLTAWHYRPEAMTEAMMQAHYPLQLLLYSVALHRFLRWRQPGYDPERHLGGGLYLFLRGMCGPQTPVLDGQPCGVLAWRPPPPLVLALSALLDGRPA